MGEQHLDLLTVAPGTFVGVGVCDGARHIARRFVDTAWNLALRRLRAAPELHWTGPAVVDAGEVAERCIIGHAAGGDQIGPLGADIAVPLSVVGVGAAEGAVVALGFVDHWYVRPGNARRVVQSILNSRNRRVRPLISICARPDDELGSGYSEEVATLNGTSPHVSMPVSWGIGWQVLVSARPPMVRTH
jgi:hypothetical protein